MSHSSSITNPNVFLEMTRPTQPLIGLPADSKTSWDSQLTANSCANASPPPPKKKRNQSLFNHMHSSLWIYFTQPQKETLQFKVGLESCREKERHEPSLAHRYPSRQKEK